MPELLFSLAGFLFIPTTDYMLKPEWSDSAAQLSLLLDLFCLKHEGLNSKQKAERLICTQMDF